MKTDSNTNLVGGTGPVTDVNITAPPAPLRCRLDAIGPSMLTDDTTPDAHCVPKNCAPIAIDEASVVSSGASPKNPFDLSTTPSPGVNSNQQGGGATADIPSDQSSSSATAVQFAPEEVVPQVKVQKTGMISKNGHNPFATDASVCSDASGSRSVQSVPSLDTSSTSPRYSSSVSGSGGNAALQQQTTNYVPQGQTQAQNPFENQTTPANSTNQTQPPPFSLSPKLSVKIPSSQEVSNVNNSGSAGNTPTNVDANTVGAVQMPPLYLPDVKPGDSSGSGVGVPSSPPFPQNDAEPYRHSGDSNAGVVLGVQQLEKQQAHWEATRGRHEMEGIATRRSVPQSQQLQQQEQQNANVLTPSRQIPPQSGIATTVSPMRSAHVPHIDPTCVDFQEHDSLAGSHHKPLVVYGYLKKQTRNGVWQRRFFETDGECLTYYKSQKRSKLLATLDLAKVGEISKDPQDYTACTFTIQVAGRPYYLRAEDPTTCKDWVINLNRVREARIQVGRIKLVDTHYQYDEVTGKRKQSGDECISRVVVKANRNRTTRLNDDEEWKTLYQLEKEEERKLQLQLAGTSSQRIAVGDGDEVTDFIATDQQGVISSRHLMPFAKWEKSATNFRQMKMKLIRWARKIRVLRCVAKEQDVMLHPAGSVREGPPSSAATSFDTNVGHTEDNTVGDSEVSNTHNDGGMVRAHNDEKGGGYPAWIGKETQIHLAQGNVTRGRTDTTIDVAGVVTSPREDEENDERTIS